MLAFFCISTIKWKEICLYILKARKKHVTGFDQSYLSPTRYDWCHVGPQESVLAEEMKRSQMLRSSEFNLYYHCYSAKQDNRRITFCLS